MTQLEAFPAEAHRRVRHRKATECAEKADALIPSWSDSAYEFLCAFARGRTEPFLTEEAIHRSKAAGVPQAHNKAAWGAIVLKARCRGVIRQAGWSTATRNAGPKPTWLPV